MCEDKRGGGSKLYHPDRGSQTPKLYETLQNLEWEFPKKNSANSDPSVPIPTKLSFRSDPQAAFRPRQASFMVLTFTTS